MIIFDFLNSIGFKNQDYALILLCPIFSAIGSLVSIVMEKYVQNDAYNIFNTSKIVGRLFVGSVLGLVLSLYLIGAISEGRSTIPRILALSILIGYSAPRIWFIQKKAVEAVAEKRIEKLLEKSLSKNINNSDKNVSK